MDETINFALTAEELKVEKINPSFEYLRKLNKCLTSVKKSNLKTISFNIGYDINIEDRIKSNLNETDQQVIEQLF